MYSKRLTAGFDMAARLHARHERKGIGTPYLSHLLGVASYVVEYGGDEDDVIAALLHDAVEDCGGLPMLDEIRREFGDTVADTVAQCSDSVTEDAGAKADWLDRKRAYVAAVTNKSPRARFVTACDKLHNATAILTDHRLGIAVDGTTVWDRFGGKSREQVVAYYTAMVAVLQDRVNDQLWTRLAGTVGALESDLQPNELGGWVAKLQMPVSARVTGDRATSV